MSEKNTSEIFPIVERYSSLDLVEVFKPETVDQLLDKITEEARAFIPDPSTPAGREEIASIAYKVARSKTYLDGLGKDLVSGWKSQAKLVDVERKRIRDGLDDLKTQVRAPLTEWEDRIKAELAAKEAEEERIRVEKEKAEAAERERVMREAQAIINAEAKRKAEKARKEAEKRKQAEIEARAKAEAEREAARKIEEAEQKARQAEREKIRAQEQAKLQLEQAEAKRLAEIKRAKEEERLAQEKEEKRQANKRHRAKIQKDAFTAVERLIGTDHAKIVCRAIADGKVPNISLNY